MVIRFNSCSLISLIHGEYRLEFKVILWDFNHVSSVTSLSRIRCRKIHVGIIVCLYATFRFNGKMN